MNIENSVGKEPLKLLAYNEIKKRIVQCTYAPGTLLNEDMLCSEIGVSRTPIRDALSRLEQEGLIVIKPKKGIQVSEITLELANSVFESRILVEPFALKKYGTRLNEEELYKIYQSFLDLQNVHSNYENDFMIDDELHSLIVRNTGNIYLNSMYDLIQAQNHRLRILAGKAKQERMQMSTSEHIAILTNCLKKDWDQAAEVMEAHLHRSKDATFEVLLKYVSHI